LIRTSEIINKINSTEERGNTVTCRKCDSEVLVKNPEKQYIIRCPSCGNEIKLTKGYREMRGFMERSKVHVSCPYCYDSGIVEIEKQIDESIYTFGYRCICPAGRGRPETGIPIATGIDLAPLLKKFNKGGIGVGK